MADALAQRGMKVILASRPRTVLPTVEEPFGVLVQHEMERHGVELWSGTEIVLDRAGGNGAVCPAKERCGKNRGLVLVATGVRPSSDLAESAGVRTGVHNAVRVNERMETDVADIFAAGDCCRDLASNAQFVYVPSVGNNLS